MIKIKVNSIIKMFFNKDLLKDIFYNGSITDTTGSNDSAKKNSFIGIFNLIKNPDVHDVSNSKYQ
jgi:hypothetical protein